MNMHLTSQRLSSIDRAGISFLRNNIALASANKFSSDDAKSHNIIKCIEYCFFLNSQRFSTRDRVKGFNFHQVFTLRTLAHFLEGELLPRVATRSCTKHWADCTAIQGTLGTSIAGFVEVAHEDGHACQNLNSSNS
jgi:hypothetical protein